MGLERRERTLRINYQILTEEQTYYTHYYHCYYYFRTFSLLFVLVFVFVNRVELGLKRMRM